KGLGGAEIDHKLELGRLHHRQVGGFCAFENASGIDASLTIRIGKVGSVAHETAGRRSRAQWALDEYRNYPQARTVIRGPGKRDSASSPTGWHNSGRTTGLNTD